jgi:tRNA(Arg) A34 adenosine deaminase TadA
MSNKRYTIVAHAFDARGRLLAVATNSYKKTHPLQKFFAEKVGHCERIFLHAEISALLRCKDKRPHTLKVWRYGMDGELRLARPCPVCMEAIKAFGVSNIWYSDEGNQMILLPV